MRHIMPVLLVMLLAACGGRGLTPDDLPTRVPSIDALATSVVLTENAPPPPYNEQISFDRVDSNLRELEGWHYTVLLAFDGAFAQTGRETSAEARAEVWFNQIASARRVVVESSGELLQRPEGDTFEAVQLGPDAFLVQRGVCLSNVEADARTAASLTAGELVGGPRVAVPFGRREVVNGIEAFEYRFEVDALALPAVRFAEDTRITEMNGELWFSAEYGVVVRYWLTLQLENARLLTNDLPVTGQLRLRYDLLDVGTIPNISVPFGC